MNRKSRKTVLHLAKEDFKFTSAHITTFPDGTRENLHGHNYQVSVNLELKCNGEGMVPFIDFNVFKKIIREICSGWDERFLVPAGSSSFKLRKKTKKEIEFTFCGDRFVLPARDVLLIPIDNIITEKLASHFLEEFLNLLGAKVNNEIESVEVRVDETQGQGATHRWEK